MLSFLSSCLIGDVSRGSKKTNRCGETFLGGNGCFPKKVDNSTCYFTIGRYW